MLAINWTFKQLKGRWNGIRPLDLRTNIRHIYSDVAFCLWAINACPLQPGTVLCPALPRSLSLPPPFPSVLHDGWLTFCVCLWKRKGLSDTIVGQSIKHNLKECPSHVYHALKLFATVWLSYQKSSKCLIAHSHKCHTQSLLEKPLFNLLTCQQIAKN